MRIYDPFYCNISKHFFVGVSLPHDIVNKGLFSFRYLLQL